MLCCCQIREMDDYQRVLRNQESLRDPTLEHPPADEDTPEGILRRYGLILVVIAHPDDDKYDNGYDNERDDEADDGDDGDADASAIRLALRDCGRGRPSECIGAKSPLLSHNRGEAAEAGADSCLEDGEGEAIALTSS